MYILTGKEEDNNIGCLFSVGLLVICTTISLSVLLFPNVLSNGWYQAISAMADFFTFIGLICIIYPVLWPDRQMRYMLAFTLLSCFILQLSIFRSLTGGIDNSVIPPDWTIYFRIGYAIFLIGFFIFIALTSFRRSSRTRENISQSLLSISESRVTIGKEFLIRYQLACKENTSITSIRITFVYQQHERISLNAGGYPGYGERTLPIYEKKNFLIDSSIPFIEEIPWTIPESLVPEEGTRKDWSVNLHVTPAKGVIIGTTYPLKVKWDWPESA